MNAPRAGRFRDVSAVYSLRVKFQSSVSHPSGTRGAFRVLVSVLRRTGSRIAAKVGIFFPPQYHLLCKDKPLS
jgi:hypothetical protein